MPALRGDQRASLDATFALHRSGERAVVAVDPTGTGKTFKAAFQVQEETGNGAFICHRKVLVDQTSERLHAMGIDHGVAMGGRHEKLDARIMVASVQTLIRKPTLMERLEWAILDECHRSEQDAVLRQAAPRCRITGLTATPVRNAQGGIRGLASQYSRMVVGMTYPAALAGGLIVAPRIYAPMRPSTAGVRVAGGEYVEADLEPVMHRVMKDVLGAYHAYCAGLRTLVFCVNVSHAEEMAREMRLDGLRPFIITGGTPASERRDILEMWRSGPPAPLLNVAVFAEGYDAPECQAVMLAVPMKSLARYMQCAGRGCRAAPGKGHYLLVDCSGSVFQHGSPAAERHWDLSSGIVAKAREAAPFRVCRKCFAVYEGPQCDLCGLAYVPRMGHVPRTDSQGALVEVPASFVPAQEMTPEVKDADLAVTDLTRHRRRCYAELSSRFHEPVLTQKVKEAMCASVPLSWNGHRVMVPKHISLLW